MFWAEIAESQVESSISGLEMRIKGNIIILRMMTRWDLTKPVLQDVIRNI